MLELLVSLQLESETLTQVLCWALERLFSRYAHGSCCSKKINFENQSYRTKKKKKKEKKRNGSGFMQTELYFYFIYQSGQ
jgi:hypothetical protein